MGATIDDIAREANVSRMTVSRVINNYPYVNEKTRQKVLDLIKKHDFNINLAAKNLAKGGKLDLICIITAIENIFNSFFYIQLIRAIDEHFNKYNHALFISNILDSSSKYQSREKLELVKNLFHGKIIKGIIVLGPVVNDERVKFLSENNVHGIIIGGKLIKENFGYVDIDNEDGANKAISYIIKCGHKKIAMIRGPKHTMASIERENAYRKTLEANGIEIREEYILDGNFTKESGVEAVKNLLKLKEFPTAIFAGNDEEAIGIYEQAKLEGLKIPDDISVCGFDDIETVSALSPPLTTVAQPFNEIGKIIAENFTKGNFLIKEKLPATLVIRDSIKKI